MLKHIIRIASFATCCCVALLLLHGTANAQERVPELDPSTIGSGLAVVGGAALLLIERFRRR